MRDSVQRSWKIWLYAAGAVLCAVLAAFFGEGAFRCWHLRNRVGELTPAGAGLEYNEWVASLSISIALAAISLLLAILLSWFTWRSWRARSHS